MDLDLKRLLSHYKREKKAQLFLCKPRGFCAGVERAIQIVVLSIKKYGKPVYVCHEIVHNRYVVKGLEEIGAIFVEKIEEIPPTRQPIIFSAHGVPRSVLQFAQKRNLFFLDATCPLVSKVHKQAILHRKRGRHIFLIGHAGHPEVIGTMGQVPEGSVTLIQTLCDVDKLKKSHSMEFGYVTQTTLSIDDTDDIIKHLRKKIPHIVAPSVESICYATTNRQLAVKMAAPHTDLFLIVGAPNSSNSKRLVEVATRYGAKYTALIQSVEDIPWKVIQDIYSPSIGVSAGASAPEIIVFQVIEAFQSRFKLSIIPSGTKEENEHFTVMKDLIDMPLEREDMAFFNGSM
ncbi:4-hydroxy-3-methylbut-2-enyl diphosphate reductase [Candidatus Endowatersipora endosymbiont of Watersipora subatra]|uniref:4-hydroxy-3-methylbut-2-enyl diphosphate reductase n=1 Tax=Candidatus Endowatersipora endosymbiont of Watersipora subatra TaxID=3077946 RepID=UPI00312C7A3D